MNLLRRAMAALCVLCIAAPSSAAPALWRFGDADTTIYLFGTIHALPPGYRWQDERIEQAMASADTLAIETVIDKDPRAVARLFPPPDPALPPILDRVPPKSRKAFARELARSNLPPSALDRMPTWQAAFMMMGVLMKHLGIERGAGVENSITPAFEAAPPAGGAPKKIEALETASAQLALFARLSESDQRELLASIIDGKRGARGDYAHMLRAWSRGDDAAIAKAFDEDRDLTPHLREVLLRERNANWTRWLKARLTVPGTVFVAVGAGHLAGPLSVQKMLAAEGISVERVLEEPLRQPGGTGVFPSPASSAVQ